MRVVDDKRFYGKKEQVLLVASFFLIGFIFLGLVDLRRFWRRGGRSIGFFMNRFYILQIRRRSFLQRRQFDPSITITTLPLHLLLMTQHRWIWLKILQLQLHKISRRSPIICLNVKEHHMLALTVTRIHVSRGQFWLWIFIKQKPFLLKHEFFLRRLFRFFDLAGGFLKPLNLDDFLLQALKFEVVFV